MTADTDNVQQRRQGLPLIIAQFIALAVTVSVLTLTKMCFNEVAQLAVAVSMVDSSMRNMDARLDRLGGAEEKTDGTRRAPLEGNGISPRRFAQLQVSWKQGVHGPGLDDYSGSALPRDRNRCLVRRWQADVAKICLETPKGQCNYSFPMVPAPNTWTIPGRTPRLQYVHGPRTWDPHNCSHTQMMCWELQLAQDHVVKEPPPEWRGGRELWREGYTSFCADPWPKGKPRDGSAPTCVGSLVDKALLPSFLRPSANEMLERIEDCGWQLHSQTAAYSAYDSSDYKQQQIFLFSQARSNV